MSTKPSGEYQPLHSEVMAERIIIYSLLMHIAGTFVKWKGLARNELSRRAAVCLTLLEPMITFYEATVVNEQYLSEDGSTSSYPMLPTDALRDLVTTAVDMGMYKVLNTDTHVASIVNCSSCGQAHASLQLYILHKDELIEGMLYSHFVICPLNNNVVYWRKE